MVRLNPPSIKDRILLLLSIKEEGKYISIEHVIEKVSRDEAAFSGTKPTPRLVRDELLALVDQGLVERSGETYAISAKGEILVRSELEQGKGFGLNRSYYLVWLARNYYPKAAEAILPFLYDRRVSVVKVFSGTRDPINDVQALFVRYKRYKPVPVPITVGSEQDLLALVYDHCVDFIPYVTSMTSSAPDYLVLDLDAGDQLKASGHSLDATKAVAESICDILDSAGVNYLVKFSGSRGFQVWAKLDNESKVFKGRSDLFPVYRKIAIAIRDKVEQEMTSDSSWKARYGLSDLAPPYTSASVANKEARRWQVLVDWSSLKPEGDVRAPYSIHHKTGLISLPVRREEIAEFQPNRADPFLFLDKSVRPVSLPDAVDPEPLLKMLGLHDLV